MSLSLRRYFSNLFVALVIEDGTCRLLGRVIKNGRTTKTMEAVFENQDTDRIDEKIVEYLKNKEKEYHGMYVSLLLDSMGQGAIPGIEATDFERYSIDLKHVNHFKMPGNWSIYASYIDVKWVSGMFDFIGLDLLYSPFVMLYKCIEKQGFKERTTLYVYNHQDSFTVAIFKEQKLLFGAFFKTATQDTSMDGAEEEMMDNWEGVEEEKGVENLIELDEMEDEEEFHSLDDLESLDSVEEMVSLDDTASHTFDEGPMGNMDEDLLLDNAESSMALFGRDMIVYKYLKSSIEEFYKNPLYASDFVEDVMIFDNHEMSHTMLGILESELMMRVRVEKVKTLDIMCDLAIKDIAL